MAGFAETFMVLTTKRGPIKNNENSTNNANNANNENPACLVAGARQTGKTTILQRMKTNKSTQYLTFDDPLEEVSAKSDPKTFLELHPSPYIFAIPVEFI